jgi:hypothetical protein
MISRRMLGAGVVAASAASMIAIGANAVASSHSRDPNNRAAPKAQGTKPSAAPARGKTHALSLATSAFAPDGSADTYFNNWDPARLAGSGCYNTGVTLPANATIKSVTAYYKDPGGGMNFELNRQNLLNHTSKILATFTSTAHPGYTSTTRKVKSGGRVNYSTYAYGLGVCPNGGTFSGATITYTTP